ncbi:MAG: 16S rRNA processing protein RimM [Acidimicrobiia bacterium]|nr:16S rRNA processing protein RimM [Acidimicrobiia bacterium]
MAVVGRIARPHGIRGQMIVNPDTDFPQDRFVPDATFFVRRGDAVEAVTITSVRFQQQRPVIGLRGVGDMNAALGYAGAELRIPIDRLVTLPTGVFYQHDLVGCTVVTEDGTAVGTVRDVEGAAGATRLVVDAGDGELLIPFAAEICVAIETQARRIAIVPPEGLLTLNAPGPRGSRAARRGASGTPRRKRGGSKAQRRPGTS